MRYKELADYLDGLAHDLKILTCLESQDQAKVREAVEILRSLDAQEPFGHVSGSVDVDGDFYKRVAIAGEKQWPKHGTAVYAAPVAAQPQQAKPLSDSEINDISAAVYSGLDREYQDFKIEFARAIDAAHGIKEQG